MRSSQQPSCLSINVRKPENFDRRRSRHVTTHTSKINQSPRSIPPRGLKFYHGDMNWWYGTLLQPRQQLLKQGCGKSVNKNYWKKKIGVHAQKPYNIKMLFFVQTSSLYPLEPHTREMRTGSLLLGIMRGLRRSSYLSSSLFPSGKLPLRMWWQLSLKSLNKLPNTRVFIAAEKWMVRSTGVGGLISLQNGNLQR